MQREERSVEMSPEPILSTIANYRGSIIDLDRDLIVGPARFASGWRGLARRLRAAGLCPADRVIVAVGNGPQFIAAWAAILFEGGSPLLVHVESPPAELKRIAQRFHARFVLTDGPQEADLQAVARSIKTLAVDSWLRLMWADLGPMNGSANQSFLELPGVPLHPTSGTTSEPRVAVRPAACAIAEVEHYVETIGIDHRDQVLAMAPMSHAYGHGWYVITPMVTGANLLSMRRFTPAMVFRACKEYNVTLMPAVGAMLAMLLFGAGDRLYAPNRPVITGGAPLSERTAANFERISGSRVRPLYGTTEAGAIAAAGKGDPTSSRGRIGRPFAGVSVEIRPSDDLPALAEGVGLVHVRSSSVMAGYLKEETLDTSILPDGWFNTGDLGWFDDEGALHLCGRQAEVINVSGMKVLPSEVEEVIAAMPGVVEVKVYSGQTRHGAQHVKAAVVVETGIDVARIRTHCEKHLVYYKRPARIVLLDMLPRSSRGKILTDQLP